MVQNLGKQHCSTAMGAFPQNYLWYYKYGSTGCWAAEVRQGCPKIAAFFDLINL